VQQQRRQVTVDALLEAAERGMIEYGIDVSVDDIATLAEVARRTVFRYFPAREDLLGAAIATASARYLQSLPQYIGGDWRTWLADLTRVMHQATARAARLYWEFTTRRLPDRIGQAYDEHRQAHQRVFDTVSATVWHEAGGHGATPQLLRQTVAAHLSPIFTRAVVVDADGTAELAADMAANAIAATVDRLLVP
jgi:AcrR family transcriptional regulator